jgi:hypothetical protein
LPSPIALAVTATKAKVLYDRPSGFKGVDDQTDTDQQEPTCHDPADDPPRHMLGKSGADLGADQPSSAQEERGENAMLEATGDKMG